MKCSRCGEECKDNQAFCLKCGTPIQVVPDFNLIEAELASNVGELMDEDKRFNTDEIDYLEDEHYDEYMPAHEVGADLELVDMDNFNNTVDMRGFDVDSTDFSGRFGSVKERKTENKKANQENEIQQEKKVFKIKAIVFSVLAAIIILTVVIVFSEFNNRNSSSNSFVELYNEGYDYYTAKNYDKALELLLSARKLASNDKEKIKVNKAILASYESIGDHDDDMIRVLKELIRLEPSEYEHYEELVGIYDSKDMTEEISNLIDSVTDVSVKSKLSDYSVPVPKFSDDGGDYDAYISLKLTTNGSNKIYYTLDGKDPTTHSTLYTEEIKLETSGKTVVKAIAVNDRGMSSKVVTNEYNITPSNLEGPAVMPDGGQYYTATDIIINVPHGVKCYYTYGKEAATPTVNDTEYTEPIKMMRGKNIFSAIYVSDTGVVSEVTQTVYQLTINSVLNYDEALRRLLSYIVNNDIAIRVERQLETTNPEETPEIVEEYVKPDGLTISFTYNSVAIIDNDEYYIIDATEYDSFGSSVNVVHYGVDTVTGDIEVIERDPENAGQYKIVKEEEETESAANQE